VIFRFADRDAQDVDYVDYHRRRRLTMPTKNPPHPGGLVLRQCIEPLGLSITDAAAALGVTRTTLSELVNEKRGISPEMAVRLSKVFGGSAESWLTQQAHYDLAQVHADRIKLKRLQLV
jgi:antitoxin HigA-1